MVQLTTHEDPQAILRDNYPLWEIIGSAVVLGVGFWALNAWFGHYVIDQLLCRTPNTLTACSDATAVATGIAAVIVAVAGTGLMVRLRIYQPLLVAIAAALILFDLGSWTSGLAWGEALGWSVLLYVLTYLLFTWLVRYKRFGIILLSSALIVALIRLILTN